MKEVTSIIEINAPMKTVWWELTDFASYPDWNPFIVRMVGELKVGNVFDVAVVPPEKKEVRFRSKVIGVEEGKEMKFHGKIMGGLMSDDHLFSCEALSDGRTRLTQKIVFKGLLVPMAGGTIKASRNGLEQMNQKMKVRCEKN